MTRKHCLRWFLAAGLLGLFAALRADNDADRQPVPLTNIQPEYPAKLQQAGIEGSPVVEFTVDAEGNVVSAAVVSPVHPKLDELALAEIRRTKFQPGTKAGKPVETHCRQKVVFRLAEPLAADPMIDKPPVPLTKIQPDYPKKLRKAGIEGSVMVDYIVDIGGNPKAVTVVYSADAKLDELALAAIKRTKFKPGLREGKPVAVRCRQKIKFALLD